MGAVHGAGAGVIRGVGCFAQVCDGTLLPSIGGVFSAVSGGVFASVSGLFATTNILPHAANGIRACIQRAVAHPAGAKVPAHAPTLEAAPEGAHPRGHATTQRSTHSAAKPTDEPTCLGARAEDQARSHHSSRNQIIRFHEYLLRDRGPSATFRRYYDGPRRFLPILIE